MNTPKGMSTSSLTAHSSCLQESRLKQPDGVEFFKCNTYCVQESNPNVIETEVGYEACWR